MNKAQYSINYIGYKDRTFVPLRNLPPGGAFAGEDEEKLRRRLCILQKIGNGAEGCSVIYDEDLTRTEREEGKIKRNHYVYEVLAVIDEVDLAVYSRLIDSRLGSGQREPEKSPMEEFIDQMFGSGWTDPSEGEKCDLGFCE